MAKSFAPLFSFIMPSLSFRRAFLLALVFSAFWGVSESLADTAATKPGIAVSLPFQAEFVERLAGDSVDVHILIPSGANHETFEASIGQLTALNSAALYLTVGHPAFTFEGRLVTEVAGEAKLRIVNGSGGVEILKEDIHYWTSPRRLLVMTKNYADALKILLPVRKVDITARESALRTEIEKLDRDLREMFAPYQDRSFLVFHPAWGYLALDYGLNQIAIEVEGKEPGILQSQAIIDRARNLSLKTVFSERGSAHESTGYVVEQLGASIVELDPVAKNWLENLRSAASKICASFGAPEKL